MDHSVALLYRMPCSDSHRCLPLSAAGTAHALCGRIRAMMSLSAPDHGSIALAIAPPSPAQSPTQSPAVPRGRSRAERPRAAPSCLTAQARSLRAESRNSNGDGHGGEPEMLPRLVTSLPRPRQAHATSVSRPIRIGLMSGTPASRPVRVTRSPKIPSGTERVDVGPHQMPTVPPHPHALTPAP